MAYAANYNTSQYNISQTCYAALIDIASQSKLSEDVLFSFPLARYNCLFICDIDGDSRSELCFATDSGLDVYRRQDSNSFAVERTFSTIDASILSSDTRPWYLTDLNGDGYADIVRAPQTGSGSSEWNAFLFTGNMFASQAVEICENTANDSFMFLDLDRDGLTDLVRIGNGTIGTYMNSDGVSFGTLQGSGCHIRNNKGVIPSQITNYNGASSFIKIDGFFVHRYSYYPFAPERRLLTSLTGNFGKYGYNSYEYLPDRSRYWYDSSLSGNISQGFSLRTPPVYVLSEERKYSSEWSGLYQDRIYSYYNGIAHNLGLGFCGFAKNRTSDCLFSPFTYTDQYHNPEKMGVLERTEMRKGSLSGESYATVVNTWDNHTTTYGKLSPRLTETESEDTLSRLSVNTTIIYDIYDYPVSISTTRSTGQGQDKYESVSRYYSHNNNVTRYVLGTVNTESVLKEGDGDNNWSWQERTEWTLDTLFRPVSRREFAGKRGHRFPPIPPGTPSKYMSDNSAEDRGVIIDSTTIIRETRWLYDSFGNIISETSAPYGIPEFVGETFLYDSTGRFLESKTDVLGRNTTYTGHNRFGKPTAITDYLGRTKHLSYDNWGNLVQTVLPNGSIESNWRSWGGTSCFTDSTSITGKPSVIIHYDALGREVRKGQQRFNGQWQWTDKEYGLNGKISRVSLPYRGTGPSNWNTYAYDRYDRPISLIEASGRVTTWSYNGASTTTCKDGLTTTRTNDANGILIAVNDTCSTASYSLRDDGQPTSITVHGNAITTFSYDSCGRKKSMVDPSLGTRTYTYAWNSDGSSQLTQTGPNGSIVTNKDKYGRTTSVQRAGEFNTTYTYDSWGKLISEVSTNNTSTTYTYDSLDRVKSIREDVPDGKWLKRDFTYGTGSNIASITYISQTDTITTETYTYAYGHNTGITLTDGTVVFCLTSENDFGQPTAITTGTVSRQYGYNAYGLPTFRKMANGALQDFSYSFNASNGNLESWADNRNNTYGSYGYDSLNRLTSCTSVGSQGSLGRQFSLAGNGNITSLSDVGLIAYGDTSSPYRATELLMPGVDTVALPRQAISYNSFDRPQNIHTMPLRRSIFFNYNSNGDRVCATYTLINHNQTTTAQKKYYIGGRYEIVTTSMVSSENLYLGGDAYSAPMVLTRINGGDWEACNIGRDYLGSITQAATADGTLLAEYSYDPWGRQRNPATLEIYAEGSEPALVLGRGFTGHEFLPWFSLYNMNARLYDPLIGRFLSPDPYVQDPDNTQNYNRYSYCLNNPLKYTDPNGEFVLTTTVIVGLCVSSALGIGAGIWQGIQISDAKHLSGSQRTWTIIGGGLIGGVAGFTGGYIGGAVGAAASVGGFLGGIASGAAAGAASGAINGFGQTMLATGDVGQSLSQMVFQAGVGSLSGAIIGGLVQGVTSYAKGNSFWDGSSTSLTDNNSLRTKAEVLRRNQEAHKEAVQRARQMLLNAGGEDITTEVSLLSQGTKVRVDISARIDNTPVLVEVKSSLTAGFTHNQQIVYPRMSVNEPIVPIGHNAYRLFGDNVGTYVTNYSFVIWRF